MNRVTTHDERYKIFNPVSTFEFLSTTVGPAWTSHVPFILNERVTYDGNKYIEEES